MLTVRLPEELENRLNVLAEKTHRAKSYYVKQALEEFLEEEEDYLLALARIEKREPKISLKEAKKQLGLDSDKDEMDD